MHTLPFVNEVDLSNNAFIGAVPASWQSSSIKRLALSNNGLTGPCTSDKYPFPVFLGDQTQLVALDLSGNPLNCSAGTILQGLAVAQYKVASLQANDLKVGSLAAVRLANCGLYGPIPPAISAFAGALQVDLSGNSLSGTLPRLGQYDVTIPSQGTKFKSMVEFFWETVSLSHGATRWQKCTQLEYLSAWAIGMRLEGH